MRLFAIFVDQSALKGAYNPNESGSSELGYYFLCQLLILIRELVIVCGKLPFAHPGKAPFIIPVPIRTKVFFAFIALEVGGTDAINIHNTQQTMRKTRMTKVIDKKQNDGGGERQLGEYLEEEGGRAETMPCARSVCEQGPLVHAPQ